MVASCWSFRHVIRSFFVVRRPLTFPQQQRQQNVFHSTTATTTRRFSSALRPRLDRNRNSNYRSLGMNHRVPQLPSMGERAQRHLRSTVPHDIGGSDIEKETTMITTIGNDGFAPTTLVDTPLLAWEQRCHALFVVLASRGLVGTDALRRAIEALTPEQYQLWGYYEKWSAAMVTLLIEQNIITEPELRRALFGPELLLLSSSVPVPHVPPMFGAGDIVRVKSYGNSSNYSSGSSSSVEWRRPHIRTPGYVYGAVGVIERVCGRHGDPSYLAFVTSSSSPPVPEVQLYRVRFQRADLWPEQQSEHSPVVVTGSDDVVEVEIYEHWLESATSSTLSSSLSEKSMEVPEPIELFDHSEKASADVQVSTPDHHHHHDHHHDHNASADDGAQHDTRPAIEERAVRNEGPPRPGQELFQALLNLLLEKDVVRADDIRVMCEKLDTAGQRLDGASLVVAAWLDGAFRRRLLNDPAAAAAELGIVTANANAPTVLTVVPNQTNVVHNLVVCTLCSCYPSGLLGIAPSWYKSSLYRARAVRFPRAVLAAFGTYLPASTMIRVHDSTADHRYLVLPARPSGTDNWSADALRALVTRDSMIGVTVPTIPP